MVFNRGRPVVVINHDSKSSVYSDPIKTSTVDLSHRSHKNGEYHHSYYGNKHSPTFSSVLNHMNLKKNNSFPQSKEEIIGRKDYLCVPGSMVSSLPHQPSPLADDCCCTSCCSCDFLYCDSPTCSKDDLSSMHSKEMKSSSDQNLNYTTSSLTESERNEQNKTDIDIRVDNSSPLKQTTDNRKQHYELDYQNPQHNDCHGDSIFYKSLKRTKSVPLDTKSKEDVRHEDQSEDHSHHTRRHRDLLSPSSSQHSSTNHFTNIFSPKVWKRSLLRLNDDRSGSRFSLRRTFSLRSSNSGHVGDGSQISFPSRKKKTQKYKIVEAKTGQVDGISFELVNKQGCFLRVKGAMLIPDREAGSDTSFNKDATFVPLKDMWFPSFFAFESVSKPSYFIRLLTKGELIIDKYDGTKDFKEEASFQLSKKPDAMSLKKDVNAWVKTSTGEYCLGKIMFVNDVMVKVEFSDGKMERCLRSESFKLVPDIVPCRRELTVGTRVLSQWLHRHTFYPGVVSAVRRGDSYDILFDDGDMGRGKSYNMRLLKNFPDIQAEINEAISTRNMNKENHRPHSPLTGTRSNPIPDKKGNFVMCQSAIHSSPMSISHTAINSPNENCVKRLSIPTCKFTFSPWETETDSQDSGYHECNKQTSDQLNNQDNINSTGNTDTSGHRRRKHGWVPTTTTLNLKNDDENETKSIPIDEHDISCTFKHSSSSLITTDETHHCH